MLGEVESWCVIDEILIFREKPLRRQRGSQNVYSVEAGHKSRRPDTSEAANLKMGSRPYNRGNKGQASFAQSFKSGFKESQLPFNDHHDDHPQAFFLHHLAAHFPTQLRTQVQRSSHVRTLQDSRDSTSYLLRMECSRQGRRFVAGSEARPPLTTRCLPGQPVNGCCPYTQCSRRKALCLLL